ncbi:arylsulfatase J-like isoform X1 [Hydractinia symbiolongicarpus]|uniref:arylsulfatase J-like isoform X1 n=2 Tax=Hydractinia symbiolongicarpus TaxID=13093 RepID=UPI00254FAE65|nr:arylsulfatase J-like isoform X1 [Hydractinia symbiolongicarpus]
MTKHLFWMIIGLVLLDVRLCIPPHIVMIVADDLGFNDVSFHGSKQIPTPNIDYLANNGIILNNYYVLPNCSPTRSAIMTGRYPIHTGMQSGTISAANPWGLGLEEKLLPQYLKEIGYKTHAIGKWHLGFFARDYTPSQRGFDSFYGHYGGHGDYWDHSLASNGYWGLDLHKDTPTTSEHIWTQWGNHSTKLFSMEAIDRIRYHSIDEPMFLYVAYQAVHSANLVEDPLQAPQSWIQKFKHIKNIGRRKYAAMVAYMDHGIGQIYKALKKRGMLDNSIIIFTSDNGGPANGLNKNWATNYPLRGAKTTVYEGGVRAAACVYSKFLKRHGIVSHDLMHATDWLPTLLSLAGYNTQQLQNLDGVDQWNTLQRGYPSPRTEVLVNIDPYVYKNAALIVGDWKLVNQSRFYDSWYQPPGKSRNNINSFVAGNKLNDARIHCGLKPKSPSYCGGKRHQPCLFNLKSDPCEYADVSKRYPIIYKIMLTRLQEHVQKMVQSRRNTKRDPKSNPKLNNGVWKPWKKLKEEETSLFSLFNKFPYSLKCELKKT